jgi:hypothetical protein
VKLTTYLLLVPRYKSVVNEGELSNTVLSSLKQVHEVDLRNELRNNLDFEYQQNLIAETLRFSQVMTDIISAGVLIQLRVLNQRHERCSI